MAPWNLAGALEPRWRPRTSPPVRCSGIYLHACEMHVYEVHTHEIHACEVLYKPMRYTLSASP
jgi:hypothetical protein